MFISNENLITNYFDSDHEKKFLDYFLIIKEIMKKYGKKIFDIHNYLEIIKKHSCDVYELIFLLKKLNKLNIKDINSIINLLKKKYSLSKKEFTIIADKNIQNQIGSFIKDMFKNVDFYYNEDKDKIGIDVKGEGYRYKRNLDRDLKLLLK